MVQRYTVCHYRHMRQKKDGEYAKVSDVIEALKKLKHTIVCSCTDCIAIENVRNNVLDLAIKSIEEA